MTFQNKAQKIICYLCLASCALTFLLSLGLLTDIYYTMFLKDYMPEVTIFKDIQPFNSTLVKLNIVLIIISVFLFITKTNSRRRYYISNIIMSIISVVVNISVSFWSIINIIKYRNIFKNEIDFNQWAKIHEMISKIEYTESTFWLDINIVASIITIIVSLLLLGNLFWKINLMKHEDELLGVNINKVVEANHEQ